MFASLFLPCRNIQIIPCDIDQFYFVDTIDLSNNNLQKLPKEICNNLQITCLYIGNNMLSYLPKDIFKLTNLEHITLNNNLYFNTVTGNPISRLRKLEILGHIV